MFSISFRWRSEGPFYYVGTEGTRTGVLRNDNGEDRCPYYIYLDLEKAGRFLDEIFGEDIPKDPGSETVTCHRLTQISMASRHCNSLIVIVTSYHKYCSDLMAMKECCSEYLISVT